MLHSSAAGSKIRKEYFPLNDRTNCLFLANEKHVIKDEGKNDKILKSIPWQQPGRFDERLRRINKNVWNDVKMYKQFEQFLKERTSLDNQSLQDIASCFRRIETRRNEILCSVGQICRNFYFINKGCLRLYEIDSKGNEVTAYFAFEDSIFTALPSFITQKPSRDFLVSHEPSDLLVISREGFFELIGHFPQFEAIYHKFMEFAFIHSQMRIYSFLGMEGIDKLKWVMEHEPQLLSRISSKTVASYLGMTNSTLSKLKAKLKMLS